MKAVTAVSPDVLKMKYHNIEEPSFLVSRFMETDEIALLVWDEGLPLNLSVCLADYGLAAPANHIFVKDYSENEGLPDSLEAAGVATKIQQVAIGFGRGWLMKLSFDGESLIEKKAA